MANLSISGICRITRDAEVRKSSTGTWYGIGIAAYRKNVKEGKQAVDFFDADIYQKNPPLGFENLLVKGKLLFIENGYLRNDQFVGADGAQKSRVKIQISTFELLSEGISSPVKVPEPPKYESKKKVVASTIHPSDLPPPKAEEKIPIPKTEETIPEFPDDEEPPF
jgi:single-stranded DNA-binding protein